MSAIATLNSAAVSSDFADRIACEFITGSAIAPCLYQVAVKTVKDTAILPGGDVSYPIHEALNWRVVRFGRQTRESLEAALLLNEDGSCWQAKLSQPIVDPKKNKPRKYEAPVGNGAKAYFPPVPPEIRQKISERYTVKVPLEGSFWDWVENHPEIPMIPTEGAKKGLALLSQGFVPLIFYGVNSGYRRLLDESRELVPDVQRFAQADRRLVFAFDRDSNDSTRRRVTVALHRLGGLLAQTGASVSIATWHLQQGKGVDDLIASCGAASWEQAYAQALSLKHWQIQQHLEQRLVYPVSLNANTIDLSSLRVDDIPLSGIIAIASPKGTGKTKLVARLIGSTQKVLAGGHRIALMRNLSTRLGLDYKGDLDKVHGEFITGGGYTLRVGLCVDSLLSIDPNKFAGCDLILDEVVQVIRHLLTSSTCAREGKRPALLARFRELIRVAQRVIVADADLDNATLAYLQSLRGEPEPVYLIRNAHESAGYGVRFIDSPDRTIIVQELMGQVRSLDAGKVLFVATDSKGTSKAIARLIAKESPEKRVLLVNSETSGGECEREFIQTPDVVLERQEYDVIICSPSVATGVSIEAPRAIAKVYGIFTGTSGTDADLAQALGRVREPVERVVWCARKGSNFSPVSRATNARELKNHLRQKSTATIRLIRSGLREDTIDGWGGYDWNLDPHLELFCHFSAQQNFAMHNLRDALLVRLKAEGNQVTVEQRETDAVMKLLLATARQEQREMDAAALVAIEDLTYLEVQLLEQKEGVSPEESKAISKFYFKDFYCLDTISTDDVLWDKEGRKRGELLNLEAQLFPGIAIDRTAKALERQAAWNQGYCPWDISNVELRRRIRAELGVDELLAKMRSGWNWAKYDLAPYAARARAMAAQIKIALHFSINDKMSDVQIIHQLLSQLGILVRQARWSRSVPRHEGEKLRVYELNTDHWEKVWAILQRRELKRQEYQRQQSVELSQHGSPVLFKFKESGHDPGEDAQWFLPETLAEVRSWLEEAANQPSVRDEILKFVPEAVVRFVENQSDRGSELPSYRFSQWTA